MRLAQTNREQAKAEPVTGAARKGHAPVTSTPSLPLALNDLHSPALRLGPGFGPLHSVVRHGLQAKLTVNEPGDQYEQEADRVAEQVMRMPDRVPHLQRKYGYGNHADEPASSPQPVVQRRASSENSSPSPAAPSIVNDVLRSPGQPLDTGTRAFMEQRFNYDFSNVRIHAGPAAAESALAVNALAYTVGRDVVFGAGQYSVDTARGKRLLAHELTHVAQQGPETVIRRDEAPPAETAKMTRLRQLLQNDDEDAAITLMGQLDTTEVQQVFASREFKELAMSAFGDAEMYRGVLAMHGDLYPSLEWMFDEETNWTMVRDVITHSATGKERVRRDNWMKEQFVGVCGDVEMADAVDLLEGTLLQKLTWMKAEDSNWSLVRAKIVATTDENQKAALYPVREMRDFFVDICDDPEMTDAVGLLGGTLLQKINWLLAEDASAEYFFRVIRTAPSTQLLTVLGDETHMKALRHWLSGSNFRRVHQMLSEGLLDWEEVSTSFSEQHYERDTPTSPWELEEFTGHVGYEIRYTRTELRVVVRIRLTGVTAPDALRTTWITGIQNRWNNQFHLENSRRLAVVFDPIFTSTNYQHSVEVHDVPATGTPREDESNFYTSTTGDTVAHEFGHMVGLEDEYRLTAADFQRLSGTAPPAGPAPAGGYTIPGLMQAGGGPVQGRHLAPFLRWLNSHRLAGERPYRLVAGP